MVVNSPSSPQKPLGTSDEDTLSIQKPQNTPSYSQGQMFFVVIAVCFGQGMITGLSTVWSYIYTKDYSLEPALSSALDTMTFIPWMLKPIWGVMSDNLPIFGYRRKSYLILLLLIGWSALFTFGVWIPPVSVLFVLLVVNNISSSFQSVVVQAVLVENAQQQARRADITEEQKAQAASNGISIFYGTRLAGTILCSFLIMLFLRENRQEFILYASTVPGIVLSLSFLLPETRRVKKTPKSPALLQHNGSALSPGSNIHQSLLRASHVEPSNLQKCKQLLKNPSVVRAILLTFLAAFVPHSTQANFLFQTNVIGFDQQFMALLKIIANVSTLLGILVYNRFFSNVDLRKYYTFTLVLTAFLSLAMLLQISRLNLEYGISDKIFTIANTFVIELGGELNSLPLLVLACRICPKNIEATVFAVMVAVNNLSSLLAGELGALLVQLLGIKESNFDNYWILMVINAGFQLLPLTIVWTTDFNSAMDQVEDQKTKSLVGSAISKSKVTSVLVVDVRGGGNGNGLIDSVGLPYVDATTIPENNDELEFVPTNIADNEQI